LQEGYSNIALFIWLLTISLMEPKLKNRCC